MMCTRCMSNYYLCDFFVEIIDNEKNDRADDDVYILHIKRYAISTCIRLGR
jgi:hypothetical protein